MRKDLTCYLQETHSKCNDINKLKVKGFKKKRYAVDRLIKRKQEQLYYYYTKLTSEQEKIIKDKEENCIIIKGEITKKM